MLILGHDHERTYSNTYVTDKKGRQVLVVNGAREDLTKTLLRFSQAKDGSLCWEILESENLSLKSYAPDKALEAEILPYARLAGKWVNPPLGSVQGDWGESDQYLIRQTSTMDLVCAAMLYTTKRLSKIYGGDPAATGLRGLDALEVDMAMTSCVPKPGYVVRPGDFTIRNVYKLYRYDNSCVILPLTGRQIRAVVEENATSLLLARHDQGKTVFFDWGDEYTSMIFGGINYTCDLSKPEGEWVQIQGFSNGRPFEEDELYLVVTNNYLLGNEGCALGSFHWEDALWSQQEEGNGEILQDLLADYCSQTCKEKGALTTEPFTWHWSLLYGTGTNEASYTE